MADYDREPLEIFKETVWVVNDPWTCEDLGSFVSKEAAELFAKTWMESN